MFTMLYIVSISEISSSSSTISSLVHSKSRLLVLYRFFFLGQLLLKWSNSPMTPQPGGLIDTPLTRGIFVGVG